MCDVTKGSGTMLRCETSDGCLFYPWQPCQRPTAHKVLQSIRISWKLHAAISAEDCNPRLNMQSDNCVLLQIGIMRGLRYEN